MVEEAGHRQQGDCGSAGRALEQATAERLMVREAHAHPRKLESGSLVVVERAFFEKDLKRLVSNCDGPFLGSNCDDYGAVLVDPVTLVECFGGQRVAIERCIVYQYPVVDLAEGIEIPEYAIAVGDGRVEDQ